nr:hypothetical protein Iba_chr07bCG9330 [Ipomoea batatas]
MADKGSQGMGKAAGKGESSKKGIFPGPKPGSVKPKERKHVSTMMGEKIGKTLIPKPQRNNKLNYQIYIAKRETETERGATMADKGSQGMGKAAKNYGGENSKGTFPGPKPGSVMPKDKKHVSTMIGEKIGKKVTSILKNDKRYRVQFRSDALVLGSGSFPSHEETTHSTIKYILQRETETERGAKMADKGSQGMGKAAKNYGGESSKGTFPGPKPGSVMPKDKKHISTMMGEKIGKKVTSILKNDKSKIKPQGQ